MLRKGATGAFFHLYLNFFSGLIKLQTFLCQRKTVVFLRRNGTQTFYKELRIDEQIKARERCSGLTIFLHYERV
jgi:hypothetical protein